LHNRERDDAGSDDDSAAAPDMLDVPPIGPARCDWKCNVFSPDPSWLAGATVFLKPNFVTRERNAAGRYYVLAARDLVDADRAAARLMGFADDDVKALEG